MGGPTSGPPNSHVASLEVTANLHQENRLEAVWSASMRHLGRPNPFFQPEAPTLRAQTRRFWAIQRCSPCGMFAIPEGRRSKRGALEGGPEWCLFQGVGWGERRPEKANVWRKHVPKSLFHTTGVVSSI